MSWQVSDTAPSGGRDTILGAFVETDGAVVEAAVRLAVWSPAEDCWVVAGRDHEPGQPDDWFFKTDRHPGTLVAWQPLPALSRAGVIHRPPVPRNCWLLADVGLPWLVLAGWSEVDERFLIADLSAGLFAGKPDPYFETETYRLEQIFGYRLLPEPPRKINGCWQ